jgi:REP-associated tyrosine transposase
MLTNGMARPLRILIPGGHYHVTCRGNERKAIFKDDRDRSLFVDKLHGSLVTYQVELHAYVLMSNHFHLMLSTPKGNLSEFMRHFNISYTAAFNRRHGRVGHLYQGRYKAIVMDQDSYLLELSRYVHLNPVRIRPYQGKGVGEQMRYLHRYGWSSLAGYLNRNGKQPWIRYDTVLGQVGGSRKRYADYVAEGLTKGYGTPWDEVTGQVVLGGEAFIERIKSRIRERGANREQPSIRELRATAPRVVLREVARQFGLTEKQITVRRTAERDARAVAMEMMYRYGAISQADIGKALGGLDYTTVSLERKRLREKLGVDKALRKAVSEIEKGLSNG